MAKHSLSMPAIGSILKQIPQNEKRFFNKALIEKIYQDYQSNAVDDIEILDRLRKNLTAKCACNLPRLYGKKRKGFNFKVYFKEKAVCNLGQFHSRLHKAEHCVCWQCNQMFRT